MAKKQPPNKTAADCFLDAVAEIVHQGMGNLIDANELRFVFDGKWSFPYALLNYENDYVFAPKLELDIDAIQVNWKRLNRQTLRHVVQHSARMEAILSGSPLTKKEQKSYRLEVARRKHGYLSAEECLESEINCKWVAVSFITDSKGRDIYILEIGEPVGDFDENVESIDEWHERKWDWKDYGVDIAGPFASLEDAEQWMAENGAFKHES